MNKKYLADYQADLDEFKEITKKFYNKEVSVAEYKGVSGGFGSYAQRGAEASMLRLRLTGGEVTKEALIFIAESIEAHNIDLVHLTTCQSIQLHNLTEASVCTLVEEAFHHGIITRGGGGDFPRNVMVSPLSGVQRCEAFDVLPYAKEAADYLLGFIKDVKMPRKLKVCFSNSAENETHATFRDLGFVANDDITFDVYSAGGLGRNPRMGTQVGSHVDPAKILYYIKAMVDTFTAYGNYENRGRARTRFMQEDLGTDGYAKAFQEKLNAVLASESLDLSIKLPQLAKTGSGTISGDRITPQKQDGLYAVAYQPPCGNPSPSLFRALSKAMEPMEDVCIRVTPDQGMYFINCTGEEAKILMDLTTDHARTRFETSVACIGAAVCQVGARDSQSLLSACIKAVRAEDFDDGVLPIIHISGCPSSCSAHQIGTLGFRGGVKQTNDGPKPAFAVYESGCARQGGENFGTELGIMAEEDIPRFFVELGKMISAQGLTYETWLETNRDKFSALINEYLK